MSDSKDIEENELPEIQVPCGTIGNSVYESIFYEGKPAILVYEKEEGFRVFPSLETATNVLQPLPEESQPYKPYRFTAADIEKANKLPSNCLERLYKTTYDEFDAFCDIEEEHKVLETTYCLLTYVQQKTTSTPYIYHHGEPGSGKTRFLDLHYRMGYRPLFSPDLPAADIYSYIGDREEGTGTIIEDEAISLREQANKMKIYRSGYRKGATTPRIEFGASGSRRMKFYKTFCCKLFAGYDIPQDQAFAERCIFVQVIQGKPKRDEIDTDDERRFAKIRNHLLLWRMMTYFEPLPKIETTLSGRLKELWKPLLQLSAPLPTNAVIKKLSEEIRTRQIEDLSESLEGKVVAAAVNICIKTGGVDTSFDELWTQFKRDVHPTREYEQLIRTDDYGEITRHRFGAKLRSAAGITNRPKKNNGKTIRVYEFDLNKLLKAAEKYHLPEEQVTWLQNYGEEPEPKD